jgi:hypothetical protein
VEELGKRFFSPADDVMMKVSGRQLTLPYLNQSGFSHPILVTDRDGLSMTLPQVSFLFLRRISIKNIERRRGLPVLSLCRMNRYLNDRIGEKHHRGAREDTMWTFKFVSAELQLLY